MVKVYCSSPHILLLCLTAILAALGPAVASEQKIVASHEVEINGKYKDNVDQEVDSNGKEVNCEQRAAEGILKDNIHASYMTIRRKNNGIYTRKANKPK